MGRGYIQMNDNIWKPVVLTIAGPNGSGKTTLTKMLSVPGTYINS